MELNIIDITSSAMRAVNKTLMNMCDVRLKQMPSVRRSDILSMMIMTPSDTFTSAVIFQQRLKDKAIKGGVVVYISKQNVESLFGVLGITAKSAEDEIRDACGEFCNVVAGAFKTEIIASGSSEDVSLSIPKNYFGVTEERIEAVISCKYTLSFSYGGKSLLVVDVFMESAD